tara:strand:+ start:147 stop:482 length:336 start_codon:yes stop_codon:yes gene_type:complete
MQKEYPVAYQAGTKANGNLFTVPPLTKTVGDLNNMKAQRSIQLQHKTNWSKDDVDDVLSDPALTKKTPDIVVQAIGELYMELDQYRNRRTDQNGETQKFTVGDIVNLHKFY